MEKETNAGYEILKTVYVGNRKFVLGYNPKAPQPYVTWKYSEQPRHCSSKRDMM